MLILADVEAEMSRFMFSEGNLIPVLAIACGSVIAIVAIIFTSVRAMVVSKNREATKREIAAYVAEGTLDPDKGIAMIEADRPAWECGTTSRKKRA